MNDRVHEAPLGPTSADTAAPGPDPADASAPGPTPTVPTPVAAQAARPMYDARAIEVRWQQRWDADGLHRRPDAPARPHYALTMYPYPSGNLHIGHWFAYAPSDSHARFMRMQGYDVFFPFGFDAFGLPAENAAIRHSVPPHQWTMDNIANMRKQLRTMGAMFDWGAEIVTCEPQYYRWNQWFFQQFLKAGLAYRERAAVDFCPSCNTTLAREQVIGEARLCERCGTPVTKKDLTQWFLRITRYADELIDGLADLDWPERVKVMQRNWIGRSRGATIDFTINGGAPITVFTTRPDTLFGATALVLAPEHPAVDQLTTASQRAAVEEYLRQTTRRTEIDRLAAEREKTGIPTGSTVGHPLSGDDIPVWVADYVLPGYGTGAVMLVPAHDERDFAFAERYNLPVRQVVRPPSNGHSQHGAYLGPGVLVNSPGFDDLISTGKLSLEEWSPSAAAEYGLPVEFEPEAKAAIVSALEQSGRGAPAVTYRLRDWLISRQRYWGTPIPIVYCASCGTVPVPDEDLPVLLPDDVAFRPTGESPLKFATDWLAVPCPRCGGAAERDTDTMDTFVDSSWYHYRYLSPHETSAPFDSRAKDIWLPVAQYTGGIEHATMHLLYTRFWTKAMRDLGLVEFDEPMRALFNQGIILGDDSDKMSKSRGNVVDPDALVTRYGADSVRAYLMFIGPWDQGGPWDSRGILGIVRWLNDVWRLATLGTTETGHKAATSARTAASATSAQSATTAQSAATSAATSAAQTAPPAEQQTLRRATHRALAAVTRDLAEFGFNTAIAELMTLRNTIKDHRAHAGSAAWSEAIEAMLLMMAPLTPHIAEELWARRGLPYSVHQQPWPHYDESLLGDETCEVAVQINGRVRDRITVPADAAEEVVVAAARATATVRRELEGAEPRRIVYVAGRLINIVV